jgi:hypothetical protein
MGMQDAQRRLAAHAQETEPQPVEAPVEPAEAEEPEQPLTVKQLLEITNGRVEPTVLGLKELGVLHDEGDSLVYTFAEPPKASAAVPPGMLVLRLTKVIKGRHKRKMLVHGEPNDEGALIPLQHVLLSWVSALSDKPMALIDELSGTDCDALMSCAQWIKHDLGNV